MAVLLVDDDEAVQTHLAELLGTAGYQVRVAARGEQALQMLAEGSFDAVLLDVVLPDLSGLEVLRRYRASGGHCPVIVLSGLAGAQDAVRALKLGATDYLTKPFTTLELKAALSRSARVAAPAPAIPEELNGPVAGAWAAPAAEPQPDARNELRSFIWASATMHRVLELIDRIADADVPVLLLGESGTGKEVVAREIHRRSRRAKGPLIKVNCAALPAELLESELFGHERGAFTGATAEKPGKFELAHGGTIFLDEIGEMAVRLQAKLLQVLQDDEFFRVGGKKSVRVDARVVVATNRELEREIEVGNFREDLYYRLNVVAIRLPPLRDRPEDVLPLVEHFLKKYGRRYQNALSELPKEVLEAFVGYGWPGNVRELENLVRRLVVLKEPALVLEELKVGRAAEKGADPPRMAEKKPPLQLPVEVSLKEIGKRAAMLAEREAILAMLQRTAWNKRKAAARLKISYKALLYKIKESGIVDPRVAEL